MSVQNHSHTCPYEKSIRPGKLNEDGTAVDDDNDDVKDYHMLPDNATANRITTFHRCLLLFPDVMRNYNSITLYPADVKCVNMDGL